MIQNRVGDVLLSCRTAPLMAVISHADVAFKFEELRELEVDATLPYVQDSNVLLSEGGEEESPTFHAGMKRRLEDEVRIAAHHCDNPFISCVCDNPFISCLCG